MLHHGTAERANCCRSAIKLNAVLPSGKLPLLYCTCSHCTTLCNELQRDAHEEEAPVRLRLTEGARGPGGADPAEPGGEPGDLFSMLLKEEAGTCTRPKNPSH